MRLVIIDDQGTVHEVVSDLDEYNLTKRYAQIEIATAVTDTVDRLRGATEPAPTERVLLRGDDIECLCGNAPQLDGFYPSDRLGHEVDPTEIQSDQAILVCWRCQRIILEQKTYGEVIGRVQLKATVRKLDTDWTVAETIGNEWRWHQGFKSREQALAFANERNQIEDK